MKKIIKIIIAIISLLFIQNNINAQSVVADDGLATKLIPLKEPSTQSFSTSSTPVQAAKPDISMQLNPTSKAAQAQSSTKQPIEEMPKPVAMSKDLIAPIPETTIDTKMNTDKYYQTNKQLIPKEVSVSKTVVTETKKPTNTTPKLANIVE